MIRICVREELEKVQKTLYGRFIALFLFYILYEERKFLVLEKALFLPEADF